MFLEIAIAVIAVLVIAVAIGLQWMPPSVLLYVPKPLVPA